MGRGMSARLTTNHHEQFGEHKTYVCVCVCVNTRGMKKEKTIASQDKSI